MRTLRRTLRQFGHDALLITHPPHVRYLTGFTGSNGWLLLRRGSAVFLTDPRYREQAALEVTCATVRVISGQTFTAALGEMKLARFLNSMGFEADHLPFTIVGNLKNMLRPLRLRPLSGMVEKLREIKTADEITAVRKAIRISEQAFRDTLPSLCPGVTETAIAVELSMRQRQLGADGDAFPPIVLFGKRSSLVHGQPCNTRLPRRGPVLIDFGCRVNGYGSDITRTLHVGRPTAAFRNAYDIVAEAQRIGCSSVRAGIPTDELDHRVRKHIREAGLGTYFEHGLGHGIGLEMHEAPLLSWRNTASLESGQLITIEPGVYLPGTFGIRIEDDLLVRENGATILTTLTRKLQVL
ncbi:MAG: aminopeptidase P family protein [Bacteroidetes bacterium]|nr:aminopeptidase P family protein [Bacteroidota bacterium]